MASCPFVNSKARNLPPILSKNIATAIVYGDEATVATLASNGPEGGNIFGGGPPKLIYFQDEN